jgi:hypothetical protein
MKTYVAVLLLVVGILWLPGCTALAKYDGEQSRPAFGATANGLNAIGTVVRGHEPKQSDPFDFILSPLTLPLWLVNLPIAVAADVVTLPYDLWAWKR